MWKVGCGRSNFVTVASRMPSSSKTAIKKKIPLVGYKVMGPKNSFEVQSRFFYFLQYKY